MFRHYFCQFQNLNDSLLLSASTLKHAMEIYSGVLFTQQIYIVMANNHTTFCEIFMPELAPIAGMSGATVQTYLCQPAIMNNSTLNSTTSTAPASHPSNSIISDQNCTDHRKQDGQ
jgi:hypothetical protein